MNKVYKEKNIFVFIVVKIIMANLCGITDTCVDSTDITAAAIIGIIIGILSGLAVVITIIIFISMLCKKNPRTPVVYVQNPVYHTAADYPASTSLNYYPPYAQSIGFEEPPPAYQQENIAQISSEKLEI